MSGAKLVEVQVDGLEMKGEFERLKQLLSSCYGPWGQRVLLHSAAGGVLAHTKRALKLLQLLKADNPLTRNVIAHLQGHAQCYQDSTLFAGMLACK